MSRLKLRTASPLFRVILGILVGCSAMLAMYMSWWALHDLALHAGGMPTDRASVFPLVVDVPAIAALLIVVFVPAPSKFLAALPWFTSTVFAVVTVLGNVAAVQLIDPAVLALGPEVAIAIGSVPPIAFLLLAHLAAVTVYRVDDTRTTKRHRTEASAPQSAPTPTRSAPAAPTAPVRTAPRTDPDELAERSAQRTELLALVANGAPVRHAARTLDVHPTTAQRWVTKARETGELTTDLAANL